MNSPLLQEDGAAWEQAARDVLANPRPLEEIKADVATARGRIAGVGVDARTCTCHPDDNPPKPCPRKFALSECCAAAAGMADATVPVDWYKRLATMALEAIEAGSSAAILMNVEGIKSHLRTAQQGKWPSWAGDPDPGAPASRHDAATQPPSCGGDGGKGDQRG